jgi:protein-S-isoprenylcysteine O-methyltransferase Ste14
MSPWIAAFILATLILGTISRASLTHPHSHGFYRFIAWEMVLALVLISLPRWFQEWHSWHQVVSWTLLFASLVPLILGLYTLRLHGKPDATKRADPTLFAFERTTKLVTSGIFHYIRHPLYCSLFLLSWGLFFKTVSILGAMLAVVATVFIFLTARMDEYECLKEFGDEYREYMKRTSMFIPHVL